MPSKWVPLEASPEVSINISIQAHPNSDKLTFGV